MSNNDLKDVRVPTFIPLDMEAKNKPKKTTKRKRTSQPEGKPNKRKTKPVTHEDGFIVADVKEASPVEENQIWIGAAIGEDAGAYSVYHGEGNQGNFSDIYVKENELQDLDYGYVLGTLRGIQSLEKGEGHLIVNTTCRDLPRAINGRGHNFHYLELASDIREAIEKSGLDIQVRHVSGRSASPEHKIATTLAEDRLKKHYALESLLEETITHSEIIKTSVDTNEEHQTSISKDVSNVHTEESQVNDFTQADEVTTTTTTTTTTITTEVVQLETDCSLSAEKLEQLQNKMDLDQKVQEEAAPSTWGSVFGIRNLLDVLYSPFKSRKST